MKKSAREKNSNKRTNRKNRLEKWITDVLNGKDYSKINQITKEAVIAVLSEYNKLISISLTAIIQTLKDDPELVNLIHNMLIPKVMDIMTIMTLTLSNTLDSIKIIY